MIYKVTFAVLVLASMSCRKVNDYRNAMVSDSTRMDLQSGNPISPTRPEALPNTADISTLDTATFGMGCFWCAEAIFQQVDGIISVQPGYAGDNEKQITLPLIENSGHAEVVQVIYDTMAIEYVALLEMFWYSHDPTTLNRQGDDIGKQYRSVVFYHSVKQKKLVEFYKQKLNESQVWKDPVVTEITQLRLFIPAPENQLNFYLKNPDNAYCKAVIEPKLEKFKKAFPARTLKNANLTKQ